MRANLGPFEVRLGRGGALKLARSQLNALHELRIRLGCRGNLVEFLWRETRLLDGSSRLGLLVLLGHSAVLLDRLDGHCRLCELLKLLVAIRRSRGRRC